MPGTLVERLPLPNLKVYTAGSVILVSVAVYHAIHATSDPAWRGNATEAFPTAELDGAPVTLDKSTQFLNSTDLRNTTELIADTMQYLMEDPLCLWALINMAYCALAVVGYGIQCAVFGRLRASETQRLKDRLWNYVFYKFIFVFGVINVQYMDEVLLWGVWFTLLGSLYLLTQLCNDRLDYAGASSSRASQLGLLTCLAGCAGASVALCACALTTLAYSHSRAAFCVAECLLVCLYSLQTIARILFQRYEVDTTAPVSYYTHLVFDASTGVVEGLDVVHMVSRARLAPSLASLVLLLRLRSVAARLAAVLRAHRRRASLQSAYPEASAEELAKVEDKCAICWQAMKEARKLPCSHMFHSACLCRWVSAHASCPVCRRALPPPPAPPAARNNNTFSFNGSGSVWWLPSLSLEVSRVPAPSPQLDALAQQMQQMFPQLSLQQLAADLRSTRDAPATVDNVLHGRLRPEDSFIEDVPETPPVRATFAPTIFVPSPMVVRAGPLPRASLAGSLATREGSMTPRERSVGPREGSLGPREGSLGPREGSLGPREGSLGLGPREGSRPRSMPRTLEVATSTTFFAEDQPEATSARTTATEPVPSLLFPKDSTDRERYLQSRKQAMIDAARRKYLDKLNAAHS